MSNVHTLLIRVDITEQNGWHIAKSKDLPGFILADKSVANIVDDLPEAIELLISERHGIDCKVVRGKYGSTTSKAKTPWVVMDRGCNTFEPALVAV